MLEVSLIPLNLMKRPPFKQKKQYDGYLQYWSPSKNEIVNAYCGSIFIGHCSSEDLAMHYCEFESSLSLNSDHLLHLRMDGPNMNEKFAQILAK